MRIPQLVAIAAAALQCLNNLSRYDVYYNVPVSHEPVCRRDPRDLWCAALRHLSVLLLAVSKISRAFLG